MLVWYRKVSDRRPSPVLTNHYDGLAGRTMGRGWRVAGSLLVKASGVVEGFRSFSDGDAVGVA